MLTGYQKKHEHFKGIISLKLFFKPTYTAICQIMGKNQLWYNPWSKPGGKHFFKSHHSMTFNNSCHRNPQGRHTENIGKMWKFKAFPANSHRVP